MSEAIYKSEPLRCWNKAKELRINYYKNYAQAKEKGGLRWTTGAASLQPLVRGLGNDVHSLTGEPYGASIANNPGFAIECQEALEAKGFARDLCAYLRNYWGAMFINKWLWGGEYPKPDFALQAHFCCMHSKWYQLVSEHEGIPFFSIDLAMGLQEDMLAHRQEFVENQCYDAIEWLEKTTGRKYDDENFIKAVYSDHENMCLWAKICELNKNIPAPLDEKSMYALYVFNALDRPSEEVTAFYHELLDEVKYRVENQIAAVPNERIRLIHDSQPPWSFLKIFRYLETYGAVSVGSFYTNCLMSSWDFKDGHLVVPKSLREQGRVLKTREDAVKAMVEVYTTIRPIHDNFVLAWPKSAYMLSLVRDWHCDGVIMHFNRGCEGTSLGCAENRLALLKEGIPVCVYEGNMGDDREFDGSETMNRIQAFMESFGIKMSAR